MNILRNIFARHIFIYAAIFFMARLWVDYAQVAERREKYLLGIFYNGYFKNCNDAKVYVDYMKRTAPQEKDYHRYLEACPEAYAQLKEIQ